MIGSIGTMEKESGSDHCSAPDSNSFLGCACSRESDTHAVPALPKIVLDRIPSPPIPQERASDLRLQAALELAGHPRVPPKPPMA